MEHRFTRVLVCSLCRCPQSFHEITISAASENAWKGTLDSVRPQGGLRVIKAPIGMACEPPPSTISTRSLRISPPGTVWPGRLRRRSPTLLPGWVDAYLRHRLKPNEGWFCSFAYADHDLVGLPVIVAPHPVLGSRCPLLRPHLMVHPIRRYCPGARACRGSASGPPGGGRSRSTKASWAQSMGRETELPCLVCPAERS